MGDGNGKKKRYYDDLSDVYERLKSEYEKPTETEVAEPEKVTTTPTDTEYGVPKDFIDYDTLGATKEEKQKRGLELLTKEVPEGQVVRSEQIRLSDLTKPTGRQYPGQIPFAIETPEETKQKVRSKEIAGELSQQLTQPLDLTTGKMEPKPFEESPYWDEHGNIHIPKLKKVPPEQRAYNKVTNTLLEIGDITKLPNFYKSDISRSIQNVLTPITGGYERMNDVIDKTKKGELKGEDLLDLPLGALESVFGTYMAGASVFSPMAEDIGNKVSEGNPELGDAIKKYLPLLVFKNPIRIAVSMTAGEKVDDLSEQVLSNTDLSQKTKDNLKEIANLATFFIVNHGIAKGQQKFKDVMDVTNLEIPQIFPKGLDTIKQYETAFKRPLTERETKLIKSFENLADPKKNPDINERKVAQQKLDELKQKAGVEEIDVYKLLYGDGKIKPPKEEVKQEIKPEKEVEDAERIRREAEETGREEGLVGEEIGGVRVRDTEKDRLGTEPSKEETEAGKRPVQEGIKYFVEDTNVGSFNIKDKISSKDIKDKGLEIYNTFEEADAVRKENIQKNIKSKKEEEQKQEEQDYQDYLKREQTKKDNDIILDQFSQLQSKYFPDDTAGRNKMAVEFSKFRKENSITGEDWWDKSLKEKKADLQKFEGQYQPEQKVEGAGEITESERKAIDNLTKNGNYVRKPSPDEKFDIQVRQTKGFGTEKKIIKNKTLTEAYDLIDKNNYAQTFELKDKEGKVYSTLKGAIGEKNLIIGSNEVFGVTTKQPPPKAEKQPYEMTRDNYIQSIIDKTPPKDAKGFKLNELVNNLGDKHLQNVQQAITEGKIKSHPDYPDLQKKEVKPVEKEKPEQKVEGEKPKKVSAKDEFKVGDIIENSEGLKQTIREIKGNSIFFTDENGQDYSGFSRSTLRELVKGGSWKRVEKPESVSTPVSLTPELTPDNNKQAAMRLFEQGKKDSEILKALNLTGREGMDKVREWRKEYGEKFLKEHIIVGGVKPAEEKKTETDPLVLKYANKINDSSWKDYVKGFADQLKNKSKEEVEKIKQGELNRFIKDLERVKQKIEDTDIGYLRERLHTGNKNSRQFFEEMTGWSLGKTNKDLPVQLEIWQKSVRDKDKYEDLTKSEKKPTLPPTKETKYDTGRQDREKAESGAEGQVAEGSIEGRTPVTAGERTTTGKPEEADTGEIAESLRNIEPLPERDYSSTELPTRPEELAGQQTTGRNVEGDTGVTRDELVREPTKRSGRNLNYSLQDKEPVRLSKGRRREVNDQVKQLLAEGKKPEELTEEEKNLLRQYTGEGGLTSGTREALNQHYTDYEVIKAIYNALDEAGIKYKKALEPAAGSGNFVGMRPDIDWTTVDIDKTNHEVLKLLYPSATHYNESFGKFKEKGFDLVISNVPFLETRAKDEFKPEIRALHDFYFVHALDLVKEGGVVAFVTSKGTMDKVWGDIRQQIINKADIIGAYRLPGGTFEKNTQTSVITDIIFLQKRPEGVKSTSSDNKAFLEVVDAKAVVGGETDAGVKINKYYSEHPENLLGTPVIGKNKLYGGALELNIEGEADLSKIKITPVERDIAAVEAKTKEEKIQEVLDHIQKGLEKEPDRLKGKGFKAHYDKEVGSSLFLRETKDGKYGFFEEKKKAPKHTFDTLRQAVEFAYDENYRRQKEINSDDTPHKWKDFEKWAEENGSLYRLDDDVLYGENIFVNKEGTQVYQKSKTVSFTDVERVAKIYEPMKAGAKNQLPEKIIKLETLKRLAELFQSGRSIGTDRVDFLVKDYATSFQKHPLKDEDLKHLFKKNGEDSYFQELSSFFDENFIPSKVFTEKVRFESGQLEIQEDSPIELKALYNENNKGLINLKKAKYLSAKDREELLSKGYAFVDGNTVQNEILYYSGNVYKKIEDAQKQLVNFDEKNKTYKLLQKQIDKLEEIKPEPKVLDEIDIRGNEPWLKEYMGRVLGWFRINVDENGHKTISTGLGKVYDRYLNNQQLVPLEEKDREGNVIHLSESEIRERVADAEEQVAKVKSHLKDRIKSDPELNESVLIKYNSTHRNYVRPDYTKAAYLIKDVLDEIPKVTKDGRHFGLRKNQIDWIVKAYYEGKGINAHDVGGGKTFAAITLARILKKRGVAKKPIFVVPAKTITKWERDIKFLFPNAKVYNLGNLSKEVRTQKLFEIANNEADFVVISHEGFTKIKLDAGSELKYFNSVVKENIEDETKSGRTLALQLEKIDEYRKIIRKTERDTRLTFDKLGFDAIIADEAHAYKNIGVNNELVKWGAGIAFSVEKGASKEIGADIGESITKQKVALKSARSYDFRFKSKYISEHNNGNNVFFLTATPTPNKPMEVFTMLRHLNDELLGEYGIVTDRDFANMFLRFGSAINPMKKRGYDNIIKAITNAQELRSILDRFVDKLAMQQMPWIELPKAEVVNHYLKQSEYHAAIQEDLERRIKDMPSGWKPEPGDDTILSVYTSGRVASIDPRLYDSVHAHYKTDTRSFNKETDKIQSVIEEVTKWRKADSNAGQIIFLDPAGHRALEENLHREIKAELLKTKKFRPQEIAIISGQEITNPDNGKERKISGDKMNQEKQRIVDLYNEGKVKIIIGTTKSAGEGLDIQVRTTDIHNVDIPYTPGEFDQRKGRGLRYGNMNDKVRLHYYFMQGTFDEMSFNIVTRKKGWNEAIWDKEVENEIDTVAEMLGGMPSDAEIRIQLEPNPIRRKELTLELQRDKYVTNLRDYKYAVSRAEGYLEQLHNDKPYYEEKIAELLKKREKIKERIEGGEDAKLFKEQREDITYRLSTYNNRLRQLPETITFQEQKVQRANDNLAELQKTVDDFVSKYIDGENIYGTIRIPSDELKAIKDEFGLSDDWIYARPEVRTDDTTITRELLKLPKYKELSPEQAKVIAAFTKEKSVNTKRFNEIDPDDVLKDMYEEIGKTDTYRLTGLADEFAKQLEQRRETRAGIQKGEDFFPEYAGIEELETKETLSARAGKGTEKWKQPEYFERMGKAISDNPYLEKYVVKQIPDEYIYGEKSDWLRNGYDPVARGFHKLKEGEEGFVEGKEIYRAIKAGRFIPHSEGGELEINSQEGVDTLAHEVAHAIEAEISKRDRGLEQEIRQWKKEVVAIAEKYAEDVPQEKELFVEAYLAHLGWNPEIKDVYKLPSTILERVNEISSASKTGKDNLPEFTSTTYPAKPISISTQKPEKAFTFESGKLELLSAQPSKAPPKKYYRGERKDQTGEIFITSDKNVAKEFGRVTEVQSSDIPENLYVADDKIDIAYKLGFLKEGDEAKENQVAYSRDFDAKVKRELENRGYEGVKYLNGTFDAEEIHIFKNVAKLKPTLQTDTPEFKKWFGKSKVVDKKGKPLIVYHGSPDARWLKESGVFQTNKEKYSTVIIGGEETALKDRAYFFTDNYNMARSYADDTRAFDYQNAEPKTIGVFLKSENPLIIDAEGSIWRKFETEIEGKKLRGTDEIVQYAKDNGYDGIIIKNVKDSYNENERKNAPKGNTYAVFSPTQIKSAIGNVGTFDPNNPNILFSMKKGQRETEARREQGQEPTPAEMMDGNVVDFGVGLGQGFTKIVDKIENKLNEKEFRDKWGISDNDYNNFKKYYREIMTSPQWFFDKEPKLRRVWDIIDRHLVRDVNEDVAIVTEDKWKNGKPFRNLTDDAKGKLAEEIKKYDQKQYDLVKYGENLELEDYDKFAKRFTDESIKKFLKDTYKPTFKQTIDFLKDLDTYIIVNEDINRNPFLEDYNASRTKDDKEFFLKEAKNKFFEAGPNNESSFENELLKLKSQDYKGKNIEVDALNNVWKKDENIRSQSAEYLVEEKYKEYENKFYFPSTRLDGKYYISAIKIPDPQEALLEGTPTERFFTTDNDVKYLEARVKELKDLGYDVKVGEFKKNQEEILRNNVTQEDLLDLAILSGLETDNKIVDRLLKNITGKGFTKHFIPKRYIPGFKYTAENIETAIHKTITSSAYFKNRTIGTKELEKTITALKKEGILKPGSANDKYIEGLRTRLDTRDEGLSKALRAVASLWYLSLRPAYIAQQVVQPINTLMPYLPVVAKELGLKQTEAEKAFAKSFLDVHRYYAWKILDKINRLQNKETKQTFGLEPDFIDISKRLERQGVGRPLRTLEIVGETVDPQRYYNTNRAMKALVGLGKIVGLPGIFVEDITRAQGIRAYWMMGKKAGLKGQELEDFISRSIAKSYGPPSGRLSKPPFYNIPGEKKILTGLRALMDSHLTFKNFAFMNYGQWGKVYRALRDDHLIRPLMYKMAAQAGLGGFKYMMWVSSVLTLLSIIYAGLDIPESPREQYKDLFMELNKIYDGLGDTLYKGLASITFDVDLSALFSQQAPFASEEYEFAQSIPGVVGGAGIESLVEPAKGIVEGKTEKMLPSGIKNIKTAKKYLEEGVHFGTRELIPKEEITKQDVLKKELGFTPLKISEAYEEEKSRQFKSSQLTDNIRNYVSENIIPLIEKNKDGDARKEFDKLFEKFRKRKDILTEKQREEIKTSRDFLNRVVMQRLEGTDKEKVKKWKDDNYYEGRQSGFKSNFKGGFKSNFQRGF